MNHNEEILETSDISVIEVAEAPKIYTKTIELSIGCEDPINYPNGRFCPLKKSLGDISTITISFTNHKKFIELNLPNVTFTIPEDNFNGSKLDIDKLEMKIRNVANATCKFCKDIKSLQR